MKSRLLFFTLFLHRFSNPPKSTFGPPWCQLGAQMTSKSEPKEGPGSHQKSTSSKNLPNSILTTIYYTLAMSATPKRHQFRSLKSPKIVEKSRLEKYLLKNDKKCLQITFLSNFGSPLVPRGGVRECTFSCFFELWAILGPKCLQGLHQEPPEPPQASLFTDFWELLEQISKLFRHPKCQRASKQKPKKGQHSVLFLNIFW